MSLPDSDSADPPPNPSASITLHRGLPVPRGTPSHRFFRGTPGGQLPPLTWPSLCGGSCTPQNQESLLRPRPTPEAASVLPFLFLTCRDNVNTSR